MGKITAKHFLNTNLKPYVISGIKHYSIYILLVANRQNTKVKSITFDEYYNEETFNDIINSKDKEDIQLIANEISTITRITEITLELLGGFDTAFITAYFKFSSMYGLNSNANTYENRSIGDLYNFYNDDKEKNNIYKIELKEKIEKELGGIKYNERYLFSILNFGSITLFEFFNDTTQTELRERIKGNTLLSREEVEEVAKEYIQNIFYHSLKRFSETIEKTKNAFLIEKYNSVFAQYDKKRRLKSWRDKYSINDL